MRRTLRVPGGRPLCEELHTSPAEIIHVYDLWPTEPWNFAMANHRITFTSRTSSGLTQPERQCSGTVFEGLDGRDFKPSGAAKTGTRSLRAAASGADESNFSVAEFGSGDEEGDETHEESVERDGFGECKAQEHQAHDVTAELGLAGHGLDGLSHQIADAGTRADRAEARRQAEGQRLLPQSRYFLSWPCVIS